MTQTGAPRQPASRPVPRQRPSVGRRKLEAELAAVRRELAELQQRYAILQKMYAWRRAVPTRRRQAGAARWPGIEV